MSAQRARSHHRSLPPMAPTPKLLVERGSWMCSDVVCRIFQIGSNMPLASASTRMSALFPCRDNDRSVDLLLVDRFQPIRLVQAVMADIQSWADGLFLDDRAAATTIRFP